MMLNLGEDAAEQEHRWLEPRVWIAPGVLSGILLIELIYVLFAQGNLDPTQQRVGARAVGEALFGPYVLAVELAGMLLLAALIGALHLGRREQREGPVDG
jgi:NADH-quinone oxidoreductase subunit J